MFNWFKKKPEIGEYQRPVVSIRLEAIGGQGANSAGKIQLWRRRLGTRTFFRKRIPLRQIFRVSLELLRWTRLSVIVLSNLTWWFPHHRSYPATQPHFGFYWATDNSQASMCGSSLISKIWFYFISIFLFLKFCFNFSSSWNTFLFQLLIAFSKWNIFPLFSYPWSF